jgi:hypothetical protein
MLCFPVCPCSGVHTPVSDCIAWLALGLRQTLNLFFVFCFLGGVDQPQEFRNRDALSPQKVPHDATPQDSKTCYAFLCVLVPVSIRPFPIASRGSPSAVSSANTPSANTHAHPANTHAHTYASDAIVCVAPSHHGLRKSSTFSPTVSKFGGIWGSARVAPMLGVGHAKTSQT